MPDEKKVDITDLVTNWQSPFEQGYWLIFEGDELDNFERDRDGRLFLIKGDEKMNVGRLERSCSCCDESSIELYAKYEIEIIDGRIWLEWEVVPR